MTGDRSGSAIVEIKLAVRGDLYERTHKPLEVFVSPYLLAPGRLNNAQGRCIEQVFRRVTLPRFRERMVEILYELPLDDGSSAQVSPKSRFTLEKITRL